MYIDLFEDQYEILKPYTEIYTVDLSVYCIDKNNKVYIIIDTFINDEETLFLRVHKVNKNGNDISSLLRFQPKLEKYFDKKDTK
jgi:hypothetical protein